MAISNFPNRAFKDVIMFVNSNLIGPKRRTNNTSDFHPMVRDDWGMVDKLRAVLGAYRITYEGSKGENTWNYAGALKQIRNGGDPAGLGAFDHGPNSLGYLRNQLNTPSANDGTNIVFDWDIWPDDTPTSQSPTAKKVPILNSTTGPVLKLQHCSPGFGSWLPLPAGAGAAWNEYVSNPAADNFLMTVASTENFLYRTYRPTVTGPEYQGLLKEILDQDQSIEDHTFALRGVSSDIKIREASGINLRVDPVYNYYASTTPPYESVIGTGGGKISATGEVLIAPSIKEYLLPNAYYLQSELNNTSSTLLAQYHLSALTLDQNMIGGKDGGGWFKFVGSQQNVTEANVDRYYDLYAEGIVAVEGNAATLASVGTSLSLNNRNFLILHSDLGVLKEDRINTTTIPFYNKITLGYDLDNRSGVSPNISILRNLYNDRDTRDFVSILQMQTVLRLTTEQLDTSEVSFTTSHKKVLSSTSAGNFVNTSETSDYNVLYDLEDLLDEYMTSDREVEIASMITDFGTRNNDDLSFRLIRDYELSADQLSVDPVHIDNAYADLYENTNSPANVSHVVRSIGEVFDVRTCHTETLMYIIKKKTTQQGAAVQIFYVSADFSNRGPTVFYDTQVKYDTDYYYDIDKVVLVFGNEYEYDEPTVTQPGGLPVIKSNIKVTNRASVKAIVVPYIMDSEGIPAIIIDKPPVPPEINFYPYKGINNKLKILLNSSTGKMEAKPVAIQGLDGKYFTSEYKSQTGESNITFEEILATGKKIQFRSDDPVDAYELFKLDRLPASYQDFKDTVISIDPETGIPGAYLDTIQPNKKHYYCARSVDIHGNRSNPTHIYEIEIVDNNGQIFLKQNVLRYTPPKETFVKSGRRFIYIEPSLSQTILEKDTANDLFPNVETQPTPSILGATGVDSVWNKTFKVRLTSKKTGRKVDLNLTFKNTGIVKASE